MSSWIPAVVTKAVKGFSKSMENLVKTEDDEIAELREHWQSVAKFFDMVHSSVDPSDPAFQTQLDDVHGYLHKILEMLKMDKRKVEKEKGQSLAMPASYKFVMQRTDGTGMDGVIFHMCQHAKLDMPHGARSIALNFLAALLSDADLVNTPLLLLGDDITAPLVDVVTRVGHDLSPSLLANASEPAKQSPGKVTSPKKRSKGTKETEAPLRAEAPPLGHVEFVKLLAVLAGKIEETPELSEFFIRYLDQHTQKFVLLDLLLQYVNASVPKDQERFSRTVLSAIGSLARSLNHLVQSFFTQDSVAGPLFRGMAEAIKQSCVPAAQGSTVEHQKSVLRLTDFVDHLIGFCPSVAKNLVLLETLERHILNDHLRRHIESANDRSFVAASLLLAHMLQSAETDAVRSAIARSLFGEHTFVALVRRLGDINSDAVTAVLILLRAVAERAPLIFLQHFTIPAGQQIGAAGQSSEVDILTLNDIDSLFGCHLTTDDELGQDNQDMSVMTSYNRGLCGGDCTKYDSEAQLRYIRMSSLLPSGSFNNTNSFAANIDQTVAAARYQCAGTHLAEDGTHVNNVVTEAVALEHAVAMAEALRDLLTRFMQLSVENALALTGLLTVLFGFPHTGVLLFVYREILRPGLLEVKDSVDTSLTGHMLQQYLYIHRTVYSIVTPQTTGGSFGQSSMSPRSRSAAGGMKAIQHGVETEFLHKCVALAEFRRELSGVLHTHALVAEVETMHFLASATQPLTAALT